MVPGGSLSKPKWDLRLETRRGKCNWALRKPMRAPLGTKIASQYMLVLTLPLRRRIGIYAKFVFELGEDVGLKAGRQIDSAGRSSSPNEDVSRYEPFTQFLPTESFYPQGVNVTRTSGCTCTRRLCIAHTYGVLERE